MTNPKSFLVILSETRVYDFIIEAESAEAARDKALSGELDFDADSFRQESTNCDVLDVSEVESKS